VRRSGALCFEKFQYFARRVAMDLAPRHLHLDILHVTAAMVLEADSFHTFDDRQKKLAKAAGLVCR